MKKYCYVYAFSFQIIFIFTLLDKLFLIESVSLLLTDPHYNTRRGRFRKNSDYDVFATQNMVDLLKMFFAFMTLGSHGNILCFLQHCSEWINSVN